MRRLLAVAELRLREAAAARVVVLLPLAFLAGLGAARWAPGTSTAERAAAADRIVLAAAGASALAVVLLLAASSFAEDVRSGRASTLLAAPVARLEVALGGIAGHAAAGLLVGIGVACSGLLGLDAGGLGASARHAVRPMEAAEVLGRGDDGFAVLGAATPEVRARFRVPKGAAEEGVLRFRLAPRGRVESGPDPQGALSARVEVAGAGASPSVRVPTKAGVAFDAFVQLPEGAPGAGVAGEEAVLVLVRERGAWQLRFGEGSIEVGGPRRAFAAEAALAVVASLPLLVFAAAFGTAASARLGAATAIGLVGAAFVALAGRGVIEDAATYVVHRAEAQEREEAHAGHGHDHGPGHGSHDVRVTPVQTALAHAALAVSGAVPDVARCWRFGEVAAGRATRPADAAQGALLAAGPCAAASLLAWLLLRRREV